MALSFRLCAGAEDGLQDDRHLWHVQRRVFGVAAIPLMDLLYLQVARVLNLRGIPLARYREQLAGMLAGARHF